MAVLVNFMNDFETLTLEKKEDGLLYLEGTDQLADGTFTGLWSDGTLKAEYSLRAGKYHGPMFHYWTNGQLSFKANFKDGIGHGEQIFYYKNGQIQAVNNIKNNVLDGLSKRYSEDGSIVELVRFKDGEKVEG